MPLRAMPVVHSDLPVRHHYTESNPRAISEPSPHPPLQTMKSPARASRPALSSAVSARGEPVGPASVLSTSRITPYGLRRRVTSLLRDRILHSRFLPAIKNGGIHTTRYRRLSSFPIFLKVFFFSKSFCSVSNWRSTQTLPDYLKQRNVMGIGNTPTPPLLDRNRCHAKAGHACCGR